MWRTARIRPIGPLLFLIYINDICDVSTVFKYTLFADDTSVVLSCITTSVSCDIDSYNILAFGLPSQQNTTIIVTYSKFNSATCNSSKET